MNARARGWALRKLNRIESESAADVYVDLWRLRIGKKQRASIISKFPKNISSRITYLDYSLRAAFSGCVLNTAISFFSVVGVHEI